jgi:ectoine hydroxylase-related dioxygenase (phytanoyl-CoA dioxygenase family)
MTKNLKFYFEKNGIAVFKKIFSYKIINQALKEINKVEIKKTHDKHIVYDLNSKIKYIKDIDSYYPYFKKFLNSKILKEASYLLGEDCYFVNMGLHSKTGPESTFTPPHQDNFYWSRKPANALTAYIAITEQKIKNGAICYLLGSHKKGVLKHRKSSVRGFSSYIDSPNLNKKKFYSPELKSGDVVFHHCNVVHKANPNQYSGLKNSRKSLAIVIYGVSTIEDKKLRNRYLRNNPKI